MYRLFGKRNVIEIYSSDPKYILQLKYLIAMHVGMYCACQLSMYNSYQCILHYTLYTLIYMFSFNKKYV